MKTYQKLCWQNNGNALYAEIEILSTKSTSGKLYLSLIKDIENKYINSIQFAYDLFKDNYSWKYPDIIMFDVHVTSVKTNSVDTSLLSIVYVTYCALCLSNCIDASEYASFDKSNGKICIFSSRI